MKNIKKKNRPQTEIFPQISWTPRSLRTVHTYTHTWSGTKGRSWYRGLLFEVSVVPHLPRWPSLVSRIHPNLGTGSGKPKETEGAIYSFRLRFARWRVIRRTADSRRALVATKPILGLARSAVRPSCRGVRHQFTEWSREPALNDQSCRVYCIALSCLPESRKAWCRFN